MSSRLTQPYAESYNTGLLKVHVKPRQTAQSPGTFAGLVADLRHVLGTHIRGLPAASDISSREADVLSASMGTCTHVKKHAQK